MTAPKATTTATVPGYGPLVFALPVDAPGRASAILTQHAAVVRGGRAPDEVRAAAEGNASLDEIEAQHNRLTAGYGLIIGYTVQNLALDAVARLRIKDPLCPSCGSDRNFLAGGERRCTACEHVWSDPDEARRFSGYGWQERFGAAVVDELVRLGISHRYVTQIGAHVQGALAHIAGSAREDDAVSFS